MSLPKEFWEQLPEKTDGELYDMLAHQADYLPEALDATRDELRKRNLSPERVAQLETTAQTHKAAEATKASERLSWPMLILIFFLCAGTAGAVLAVYYDSKGYKQKASDCWTTMAISLAAHVLFGGCLALTR
jgi:hypothetical protein